MPNQTNESKGLFQGKMERIGNGLAEGIAQAIFRSEKQKFEKELSLKQCLAWIKEVKGDYPSAVYCMFSVKEIPIPDTKETGLSVTLILMDNEMNPVKLDEKRAVSTIFQAETIDESLINLLNGEKNALISL